LLRLRQHRPKLMRRGRSDPCLAPAPLRDARSRWWLAPLCATLAAFATLNHGAFAQTAPPASAPPPPPPPSQSSSEPYVDRLLPASAIEQSEREDEDRRDTSGWPRSIRIEVQWAQSRSSGITTGGSGLGMRGTLDTPNFGGLSFDAQVGGGQRFITSTDDNRRAFAFTLTQLGMPLANGWITNNTLGITSPSQVPVARQQSRIGLPTRAIEGAATEFVSPNGLLLTGSAGRVGQLEGYPSARFRATDGDYAALGGQMPIATAAGIFTSAVNAAFVRGAPNELGLFATPDRAAARTADFDALFVAERFRRGEIEIQGNYVRSTATTGAQRVTANGFWLDAELNLNRSRHTAGLFYLEPNLNWGGLAMNSDVEGAYYRFSSQTLKWTSDLSLEALRPVDGRTASGGFASGSLRYRVSRDVSAGGGLTFREFAGRGGQAFAYVQSRNSFGNGRVQLDFTDATTGEQSESLTLDQSFDTAQGLRLSTTLSLSNQRAPNLSRKVASVSFAGGYDFFDSLSIDTNIQSRTTLAGPKDDALYGTIGLQWRFARNWSLNANAVVGRGRYDTGVILDPLATPTTIVTRPSQRSIVLSVRYEERAGSLITPLGGRLGGGGATLSGVVFLDANANGVADANEAGVPNVTVLLDGKFTARTDAQGRYEFVFVGAGEHTISLITDNLPLPWAVTNEGATRVKVSPRQTTRVDIGATRLQ
jgi:SdrD B-like domain